MPRHTTTAELAELVRPFAGAKLRRQRGSAIDILCTTRKINADVRDVTREGVSVFFYDRCDLVAWGDVREVTVRALDADGNTTGSVTYEHRALRRAA